jgi:methylated-DNA-protein-cysteine methyltransferase related protein
VPGSPFFVRIKGQVLQLTAAIPTGRICTFQSVGAHLDVMPRHVAYILSQLEDNEKMAYPWHRVVTGDRTLGTLKTNPDGSSQADLLRAEGVLVNGNKVGSEFERIFVSAQDLPSGLPRQKRPPDAPVPKQSRSKSVRASDA